jgi:hypothetical protein
MIPNRFDPQETYRDFLSDLFGVLARNKPLPKYQFERRVDIFLTMFLEEIFYELFGWQVELVVPEFPLKKADNNQSTNVDHLLFRHGDEERWLFFELKTDRLSVRDNQMAIYREAMDKGMLALIEDLSPIRKATHARNREKYDLLVERLTVFPLNRPIELVYLAPSPVAMLNDGEHSVTFAQLYDLELKRYPEVWELVRTVILPAIR